MNTDTNPVKTRHVRIAAACESLHLAIEALSRASAHLTECGLSTPAIEHTNAAIKQARVGYEHAKLFAARLP